MFFLVLIASIVGLSQMMGLSVIVAVAAASLFLPVVWMTCIGRLPVYEKEFRGDYFKRKLPSAGNQIALFVGAGFFAQGMSSSHVGDVLMGALAQVAGQSVLLLTVAVIGLVLATSAVGIHPVAIVAVAGGAMSASGCGITPTYAALVLSISWAMGNALCPASANVVARIFFLPLDSGVAPTTSYAVAAFFPKDIEYGIKSVQMGGGRTVAPEIRVS